MSLQIPGVPSDFVIPDISGLDFSQHDSTTAKFIKVNAVFIGIIAVIILLRLYVRLTIVKKVGFDDCEWRLSCWTP
jgi:hypothetical protein